jgi:hypothetical protein
LIIHSNRNDDYWLGGWMGGCQLMISEKEQSSAVALSARHCGKRTDENNI